MKKVFVVFLLVLTIGALTVYSALVADAKSSKGDLMVISKKVKPAPTDASSPQWKEAEKARIVVTGAGDVEGNINTMKVRSVYTKDEIFFLFQWHDYNKSMNKKRWKFTGGKWTKIKGDEDRLGVVWEINRIDKFATKGCTILCHNEAKNPEDWYYATSSPREKADLWHWKAVRSNPVGYTEDGYVIANPSKKPEEGRKRDASSDTKAKSNRTKDKSKPAYMQNPSKPPSIPGSLLVEEAVKITGKSKFEEGDEIPGYMLNSVWKGSFADVKTKGVWQNGKWTVMMRRKLQTGNDDDVQFNTRKTYPFGIAVFDNAHEHNSYNAEPLKLKFK
ncbi:MAG: ethylbenzene dehydrogenase-related protein [Syntrophobacteria bacterium]